VPVVSGQASWPWPHTTTLAVAESDPSITHLFSKNAIFLDEIFDYAILTLIQPTGDGDD
jgi:hypothetical protein